MKKFREIRASVADGLQEEYSLLKVDFTKWIQQNGEDWIAGILDYPYQISHKRFGPALCAVIKAYNMPEPLTRTLHVRFERIKGVVYIGPKKDADLLQWMRAAGLLGENLVLEEDEEK